jgi:hypothetical protein
MDYELDFDFLFNVYTVTINGDVVLTGTDDYEKQKSTPNNWLTKCAKVDNNWIWVYNRILDS